MARGLPLVSVQSAVRSGRVDESDAAVGWLAAFTDLVATPSMDHGDGGSLTPGLSRAPAGPRACAIIGGCAVRVSPQLRVAAAGRGQACVLYAALRQRS
ncbi:hypothetical protein GUJ93_ZPchr0076g18687 [Zizania palustris]|uniref:Uncharacterized protein n=1 Tax=Zizania palustris TaxID=103762 RepID=A0A8J5RTI7_ZIZPA|nr:hypothetical protein GUJ93_ZPchr0076g18687 [Zizania palustris]